MSWIRCSLAFPLVGLLGGCAAHHAPIFEPLPVPKYRYETETAQVFIKDERKSVSHNQNFATPIFSLPGDGESRALAASPDLQREMAALLARWVPRAGSDRLYFEVYMHRADAGWVAHWFDEEAWSTVELRVCAIDGTDNSVLVTGRAWSSANVESADVSDGEPARLLNAAALNAWGRWVQSDRVIARVNQALNEKRRWGRLLRPVSCQH